MNDGDGGDDGCFSVLISNNALKKECMKLQKENKKLKKSRISIKANLRKANKLIKELQNEKTHHTIDITNMG